MADVNDFTNDLKRFDAKVRDLVTEAFVETTKEARLLLAEATPKLTGRHSASWNASVGSPNYTVKPDTYNNPGGAPHDGEVDVDKFRLGQDLYIANAAPVIELLNAGHSAKAPAGFIDSIAGQVSQMVPRQIQRLRGKYKV